MAKRPLPGFVEGWQCRSLTRLGYMGNLPSGTGFAVVILDATRGEKTLETLEQLRLSASHAAAQCVYLASERLVGHQEVKWEHL